MEHWQPRRHQPLQELEPDLWAVEAEVKPGFPLPCRMFVVRLAGAQLLFINAVPLDEPSMRDLESWGTPAFLLVPSDLHRLDLPAYKLRYPGLRILASEAHRVRVGQAVPVDGGLELLPAGGALRITPLDGAPGEVAVRVGGSLCFPGDVLFNVPHQPGLRGLFFRLAGSTGGPRVTRIAREFIVEDRDKLRACLQALATTRPGRLVPCHGDIIQERPGEVLQNVAARL